MAKRADIPKPYNNGEWTQARFNSFIKSALRKARWPVKYLAIKGAFVENGLNPKTGRKCKLHRCEHCKELFPQNGVQVDHIKPVLGVIPSKYLYWDTIIEHMFCEIDNLQVLCKECHKSKTQQEREGRKEFEKQFKYVIYETTNKINGKKYIGVHGCQDLDDGYLGSGKVLLNAVKKYGKENFSRKILHYSFDKEEAYDKEAELVNREVVLDEKYYNVKGGGQSSPEMTDELRKKIGQRPYAKGKDHLKAKAVICIETGEIFESITSTGLKHITRAINEGTCAGGYHWKYEGTETPASLKTTRKAFRPVLCKETGVVYKSLSSAARSVGGPKSTGSKIGEVCRGKRKSAYSYTWEFFENVEISTGKRREEEI